MKIESPAFKNNKMIPVQYTCDGDNTSPPLTFSNIPPNAESLVLIVEDPDVSENIREDGLWTHWIVWNIPSQTTEIEAGGKINGMVGENTGGTMGYQGPCPPDGEHRYFFRLFALDTTLELPPGTARVELENTMREHVIETAELMGRYQKPQPKSQEQMI